MAKLTVTCFWWYDRFAKCRGIYTYTADHVRLLKSMVDRHCSLDYEFVCVTDRPDEIDFCRTVVMNKETFVPGTRYGKLMMYREASKQLIGERILYLDLDCVIVDSIDPIADRDEDLVLWRNPNFPAKRRARYNTSIILHRTGTRTDLHTKFNKAHHPQYLRGKVGGTDQAWISYMCDEVTEAHWTNKQGVYGAGRLRDIVAGVGTELPKNARIVFFPGSREPGMAKTQALHPWIREHLH